MTQISSCDSDVFVFSLPVFLAVSCGTKKPTAPGLKAAPGLFQSSTAGAEASSSGERAMSDGERSPLLSEQHDGTNGFSSPGGGGSHGYLSKPQSMSATHLHNRVYELLMNNSGQNESVHVRRNVQ